ncbi:hypothetical protein JS756_02970 [Streptomyces actuosus]|uniref:Uncharacterized protein n=1 Tax=Streptomyces actuosus TaxID=1885 RepID=A0ABS2VJ23_STRAS|nr:hypothetical protein [Streptomyces actuosus]MBN0043091.1 hypothetical protein [Streptomyces actuosus]
MHSIAQASTATPDEQRAPTALQVLMEDVVDGCSMRLEWRGEHLWLAVDDGRECVVDAERVLQLLKKYSRRPGEVTA